MTDEQKDENEEVAEEVEEQGFKFPHDDDEPPAEGLDDSDDADDGEVEEQKRMSDATLKRSIAPIPSACTALR